MLFNSKERNVISLFRDFMTKNAPHEQLEIRELTIDDLAAVFHWVSCCLLRVLVKHVPHLDEYEITTLFNSDNELCLVAELDGQIVGFALAPRWKSRVCLEVRYLVWIGVRPGLQKAGLAANCSMN